MREEGEKERKKKAEGRKGGGREGEKDIQVEVVSRLSTKVLHVKGRVMNSSQFPNLRLFKNATGRNERKKGMTTAERFSTKR